jgi:antitoxin MazE
METHIQKWGNSLGVRIPIHLAKQLQLQSGSVVNISIEEGRLIIKSNKYDLDMMLKEITPQNLHHLKLEDSEQLGNEAW